MRCERVLIKDVEATLKFLRSRGACVRNCKVKKLSDGTAAISIKEDVDLCLFKDFPVALVSESCYEDFSCGTLRPTFKDLLIDWFQTGISGGDLGLIQPVY